MAGGLETYRRLREISGESVNSFNEFGDSLAATLFRGIFQIGAKVRVKAQLGHCLVYSLFHGSVFSVQVATPPKLGVDPNPY